MPPKKSRKTGVGKGKAKSAQQPAESSKAAAQDDRTPPENSHDVQTKEGHSASGDPMDVDSSQNYVDLLKSVGFENLSIQNQLEVKESIVKSILGFDSSSYRREFRFSEVYDEQIHEDQIPAAFILTIYDVEFDTEKFKLIMAARGELTYWKDHGCPTQEVPLLSAFTPLLASRRRGKGKAKQEILKAVEAKKMAKAKVKAKGKAKIDPEEGSSEDETSVGRISDGVQMFIDQLKENEVAEEVEEPYEEEKVTKKDSKREKNVKDVWYKKMAMYFATIGYQPYAPAKTKGGKVLRRILDRYELDDDTIPVTMVKLGSAKARTYHINLVEKLGLDEKFWKRIIPRDFDFSNEDTAIVITADDEGVKREHFWAIEMYLRKCAKLDTDPNDTTMDFETVLKYIRTSKLCTDNDIVSLKRHCADGLQAWADMGSKNSEYPSEYTMSLDRFKECYETAEGDPVRFFAIQQVQKLTTDHYAGNGPDWLFELISNDQRIAADYAIYCTRIINGDYEGQDNFGLGGPRYWVPGGEGGQWSQHLGTYQDFNGYEDTPMEWSDSSAEESEGEEEAGSEAETEPEAAASGRKRRNEDGADGGGSSKKPRRKMGYRLQSVLQDYGFH